MCFMIGYKCKEDMGKTAVHSVDMRIYGELWGHPLHRK